MGKLTGTIETTDKNINTKISILQTLTEMLKNIDSDINYEATSRTNIYLLEENLEKVQEDYDVGSSDILMEYYMEKENGNEKKNTRLKHFDEYYAFLKKENIVNRLDVLYRKIKKHPSKDILEDKNMVDFEAKIKKYSRVGVSLGKKNKNSDNICPKCKTELKIFPTNSEMVCTECALIVPLYGTVFEDSQFYHQEGIRTKHGKYDPAKHFTSWMNKIQARDTVNIPKTVINVVKRYIKRDNVINLSRVTCEKIRKYLQYAKKSRYNENAPLIRKKITGITPPQLTDDEHQICRSIFSKVMTIFIKIKPETKTNCPYHPYFFYKIIEHVLRGRKNKRRRNGILACIHLQSRDTLTDNDILWENICKYIPEIKYRPTDPNKILERF